MFTNKKINKYYIALIILLLSAWSPHIKDYIPSSEDYLFKIKYEEGMMNYIYECYSVSGIRRSFGKISNLPICATPNEYTGFLVLILHITASSLLFFASRRISHSNQIAFISSLILAIYPFTYLAITWAIGSYIISCLIWFLSALILCMQCAENKNKNHYSKSILIFLISFFCCVNNEHLILATPFIGILAVSWSGENIISSKILKYKWVAAPILAFCFYVILVLMTQRGSGLMDTNGNDVSLINNLNLPTIISVWVHQWENLLYFQPLFSFKSISVFVYQNEVKSLILGFAFLIFGLYIVLNSQNAKYNITNDNSKAVNKTKYVTVIMVFILMLSVSSVHALAGGYSVSARHQYVPIALICLLFASIGNIYSNQILFVIQKKFFILSICLLGVFSNWIVLSINNYELKSYYAICEYLKNDDSVNQFSIQLEPPFFHLWPHMKNTTSSDYFSEYSINLFLKYHQSHQVTIVNDNNATNCILVKRNLNSIQISKK